MNGSAFDRVDWPWANCQLMATLEIQGETRPLNISRETNERTIFEGDARSSPRQASSLCPEISLTRLSLISCNGTTSDFCFLFPFFQKGIKRGSRDSKGWRKVGQEGGAGGELAKLAPKKLFRRG